MSLRTLSFTGKCWQAVSPELNSILNDVIKVINHIKAHALNSHLFEQLCEEMDESKRLLLHTEVRWLLKGDRWRECLSYERRCRDFFQKKSCHCQHISVTRNGLQNSLTCATFNLLNELNLSLQEKMTTVFKLADKVAAFKAKLELRGRRGIFSMFQTLAGILEETEPEPSFSQLMHDHLSLLLKEFERYFPTTKDQRTAKECIHDPFVNKPGESINCWRLQMTVAFKVCFRQQLCRCSGLKPRQNILRSPKKH